MTLPKPYFLQAAFPGGRNLQNQFPVLPLLRRMGSVFYYYYFKKRIFPRYPKSKQDL